MDKNGQPAYNDVVVEDHGSYSKSFDAIHFPNPARIFQWSITTDHRIILRLINRSSNQYQFNSYTNTKGDTTSLTMHCQSHPIKRLQGRNLSHTKGSSVLGEHGIFRLGGKLEEGSLYFDAKHPVLLPASDHITRTIMEDISRNHCHVDLQGLLALTRQTLWPLKGAIYCAQMPQMHSSQSGAT